MIWLAAGLIGGGITVENIYDSRQDRGVVEALRGDKTMHKTHWKMIALAQHDREESQWARLAVCSLIVGSGTFGVFQANPYGGETTWTGFVVTCTLVGIAALTALRSWREYRNRERLYDLAMDRSDVIAAKMQARNPRPRKKNGAESEPVSTQREEPK